jgi:hypothetical protein
MRRLRASVVPAVLLALVGGMAALVPEAGHTRAHREGHVPAVRGHEEHTDDHANPSATIGHGHASADHAHLDQLAATPGKPVLFHAAVARVDMELGDSTGRVLRASLVLAHGLAPPEQAQAPPPATRAPPLA